MATSGGARCWPKDAGKRRVTTKRQRGLADLRRKTIPLLTAALLASLAWVATFAVDAPTAAAHANQLRANPQPDQVLDAAPERVIVWFTEPIEPAFSQISVLDTAGAEMATGDTVVDPTEPQAMWRALSPLPNGTYTVVWRNVSTIDGHRVIGSYLFAVGEPIGSGATVNAAAQPFLQSPADPFIRWTAYLAIAVIVGGLMFEMFIVSNMLASPTAPSSSTALARRISTRAARLMLVAGAVLITAQIAQLIQQTALLSDGSAATWVTQLPSVALDSAWGINWSMKTAAAVVATALILIAHRLRQQHASDDATDSEDYANVLMTDSLFGALAFAAGLAYLVLVSLSSHNAAAPEDIRWLAIVGDATHIAAASAWVGGLLYLLVSASVVLTSDRRQDATRFLLAASLRFTPVAVVAAAALFASGIMVALVQVAVPDAIATPYGLVVVVKAALAVPLVAIAIYNMVSLARRVNTDALATTKLRNSVIAEIAIAACALLAAGWLASLEPARQYAERNGIGISDSATQREVIDGATIEVMVEPGTVGANVLSVSMSDDDGAPFSAVAHVRARVRYLDSEFGEPFMTLPQTSDGVWSSDSIQLGIGGAYQVEANIARTDAFDSNVAFRFSARSTTAAADQLRASFGSVSLALGAVIAITGLALIATRAVGTQTRILELRRATTKPGALGYGGVAVVLIGLVVAVNPWTLGAGAPTDLLRNPWPPTQASVSAGTALYATACASCHGDTGRGDGVAASALNPPPSDLAVHVPLHTDSELYDFIANGIDGTAMVARSDDLSAEETWHIINYIRTIDE